MVVLLIYFLQVLFYVSWYIDSFYKKISPHFGIKLIVLVLESMIINTLFEPYCYCYLTEIVFKISRWVKLQYYRLLLYQIKTACFMECYQHCTYNRIQRVFIP